MRLEKLISVVLILFVIGCDDSVENKSDISATNNVTEVNVVQDSDTTKAAKLIAETTEALITLGENIIKNHKVKDSIRSAEREKLYGYRIGLPISDKDEVFEAYNKLNATENIYALKQTRQDYFLVYYNGFSKEQLEDSLETYRLKLPSEFKNTLKVINIMDLCSNSKQNLMVDEKLSKRKSETEIPCLICDK